MKDLETTSMVNLIRKDSIMYRFYTVMVLSLLVILAACSPAEPPAPTPDIDAIVAATVTAERNSFYQPQLVAPVDGATLQDVTNVRLEWEWVRDLREGEAYDVRVWQEGEPAYGITWTQDTIFNLSDWLTQREPGEYFWSIAVVEGSDGTLESVIGEAPPEQQFTITDVTLPTPTVPPPPQMDAVEDIVRVPPDFEAQIVAHLPELSTAITSIEFTPEGDLLVLAQAGQLLRLRDTDGDFVFDEQTDLLLADDSDPVELAWAIGLELYEDRYYISDGGRIGYFEDTDDDPQLDTYTVIIEDLPSRIYPLHSNNGIIFDANDKLYVGIGSVTDHGPLRDEYPYSASILQMNPDGSDVRVYATGLRNPYGLTLSPDGEMFTGDNGPDALDQVMPFYPPEELNHIREGRDYGFPDVYGQGIAIREHDRETEPAVTEFTTSSVTSGLTYYAADHFPPAYRNGVFVAQYGGFNGQGKAVVFVELTSTDDGTYTGTWERFARFVNGHKPVDVTVGPDGSLYMSDWHDGYLLRVSYTGGEESTESDDMTGDDE
jgi:glucose/arabinose dehydrogenase